MLLLLVLAIEAAADSPNIEMHNPLTSFQQCSHDNEEWHICRGEKRPEWYCPTVLDFNASQLEDIAPCFTCPDAGSDCETAVSEFLELHDISEETIFDDNVSSNIADELLTSCRDLCEAGSKGDACRSNDDHDSCTPGSHFCDFASDEDFAKNISGTCIACPLDRNECYQDGFLTSSRGKQNCADCRLNCSEVGQSMLIVNGTEIPSSPILGAIQKSYQNVSGPLIDCSHLLRDNDDNCPGAEGHICIIDPKILRKYEVAELPWELSSAAEANGCVAIVAIDIYYWYEYSNLAIPIVIISKEDANQWLTSDYDVVAHIEVQLFGSSCSRNRFSCNTKLPCGQGQFCHYLDVVIDEEYTEGHCDVCPTFDNGEPDPARCFFKQDHYWDITFSFSSPEAVKSCASLCNATLSSDGCKFCPSEVSVIDFGVENEADQCFFCPNNDVIYPDEIVPLFGGNITCWMLQTFFDRMRVPKDSYNCRLIQSMNYICGCNGTGYAGANTHTKQVVLVWLPRVAAIFSMVGSLFIIYDTLRTPQKRNKLRSQLLSSLSFFDILGSVAYALTTLPTPQSDHLFGAQGNEQSCTAQGFFIQVGTIACFLNVSLAVYYLLTIKYGWTEERLKKKHVLGFLFAPPIVIGLVFAFVGIPYYDNVRVWCNNSAKWWPEIPVICSIIAATGIMGTLWYHVYKNEKRTYRYTYSGSRRSMMVFKQSCWFVIAFYITWVPYLTLQYMLSSGKGYDDYGLILSAATLVPLQGFWNNIVYIRTRYLGTIISYVGSTSRRFSSYFQRSSNPDITEQSALESFQQSTAHDQLQVLQFNRSSLEDTLFEQGENTISLKKKEKESKPLETTPKMVHFTEDPAIRTFSEEENARNDLNGNEEDGDMRENSDR
eukprot:CCRYP_020493-RB/>CCRYP_020493-RB protein AED:0.05 eAED:0.05 QI:45/1/1/1/0.75/0.8/5/445/885